MVPDSLEKMLRSSNLQTRLKAVRLVGEPMDDEAYPDDETRCQLLIGALDDKSNRVVAAAAEALQSMLCREAVAPLIRAYDRLSTRGAASDPGCVGRWQVVTSLTRLVSHFGIDPEADFFPGSNDVDCRTVHDCLLKGIETVQIEPSGNGRDDMAVGLRGQCALAMATLRTPGALLHIGLLLFDSGSMPELMKPPEEEPFVTILARRSAARALGAMGDQGAVPLLGVKLTYPEGEMPEVLVECMDAVAALDGESALKLLPPYLSLGDRDGAASQLYMAAAAATALASLHPSYHARVSGLLIATCTQSLLDDVRQSMALAVASMRSDMALDSLDELASHASSHVRAAAVLGLEAMGGKRAKQLLDRLASVDDDERVRILATEALTEDGL